VCKVPSARGASARCECSGRVSMQELFFDFLGQSREAVQHCAHCCLGDDVSPMKYPQKFVFKKIDFFVRDPEQKIRTPNKKIIAFL
jgi:hypothetical protein